MMTRGIADPLALAYCHLYMVHCAQKLHQHDVGMTFIVLFMSLETTRTWKIFLTFVYFARRF